MGYSSGRPNLLSLRVQVPNNYILTQNLYQNDYYPNPKYVIIGYMDPLGIWDPGRFGVENGSPARCKWPGRRLDGFRV